MLRAIRPLIYTQKKLIGMTNANIDITKVDNIKKKTNVSQD